MIKYIKPELLKSVLKNISLDFDSDYVEVIEKIKNKIREYYSSIKMDKFSSKPKLIIGLSGGVDSAVVTTLASKAIGSDNIITINMPAFKDTNGINRAKKLSIMLGTNHHIINIKPIISNYTNLIDANLQIKEIDKTDKIRNGNIASRTRITILYDFAKLFNGRVLGTMIRTEYLLGYAAKWGTPMCYDFGILNHLYKFELYIIGKLLRIPKEIYNSTPTTGYYLGQSHKDEIGANLFELDAIAYLLFQKKLTPAHVITKLNIDEELIIKFLKWHKSNFHKFNKIQQSIKLRNF